MNVSLNCEGELQQFGALLFSPPYESGDCQKMHVCVACWMYLMKKRGGG